MHRRLILVTPLLLAAFGCTSSTPPKLYTIVSRPGADGGRAPATVMVRTVEVAKYLDRPQIVRYGAPYELEANEFERWGEGMRDMTTRVLVEDLALRLPRSQVYAGSGPLTITADATVELEITRFDPDPDGAVVLAARWVVQQQRRSPRLRTERIRVAPASKDTDALVAAMSDALAQLGDHIAADLVGVVAGR
jgi:uncharacterized lipoprotein YmbA